MKNAKIFLVEGKQKLTSMIETSYSAKGWTKELNLIS
jgi:hypothetical protein